jgi:hypothetical protein
MPAPVTVTVTDADNVSDAKQAFQLTVNAELVATMPASITCVQTGACTPAAPVPVTATGGTGPRTYLVTPPLPTGLSITSAGQITANPPIAVHALQTHQVIVTDSIGAADTASFQLRVTGALTVTPDPAFAIVACTINVACLPATPFTPVTASGGTAPYTFAAPGLPAGLTMTPTGTNGGQVTGTPTATFSQASVAVNVTDAASVAASASFQLTVNPALVTVPKTPIGCTVGFACADTLVTASGGTQPLTDSVSSNLPPNLTHSLSNGRVLLAGTPTTPGTSNLTVTVTDAVLASSSQSVQLTVNAAPVATPIGSNSYECDISDRDCAVGPPPLTSVGSPFSVFTLTGGTGPFNCTPLTLPTGLTWNTTGPNACKITVGTLSVTSPGTMYMVTLTDARGATATHTFALRVVP